MANEVLATYSPEDVTVVISIPETGTSHTVNGYIDGAFVSISRLVLGSEPYAGSDNSHARVVRGNKSASVTLSLAQYSESNDILSQLVENDSRTRDDTWLFSLMIKDQSGRSLYFSRQCYIGGQPDSIFSNTVEGREWMIHCVKLEQHLGGNSRFSPSGGQEYADLGGEVAERWNS